MMLRPAFPCRSWSPVPTAEPSSRARSLTVCEGQERPVQEPEGWPQRAPTTASALTDLAAPQGQHPVPDTRQRVEREAGEASVVLLNWYTVNVQRKRLNVFSFGRSLDHGCWLFASTLRGFAALARLPHLLVECFVRRNYEHFQEHPTRVEPVSRRKREVAHHSIFGRSVRA